ncbi:hypothetical protein [Parvibaculum sp.]|uniref:hypothetical protein n=1 Tax=Parvibaculum sp. TaxID=2024848 RepID=UPI003299D7DE
MTKFKNTLLAGAAGLALMAGPALAESGIDTAPAGDVQMEGTIDQAPAGDMQTEGAVELNAGADAVAQLENLGYNDVEPIDAQGDAAAEGQAYYTGTNAEGDSVTILFDEEAGTVISEEPVE